MDNYICPQCGFDTDELYEGYCKDCLEERNNELQEFLHRESWWHSLNDNEKNNIIKRSY